MSIRVVCSRCQNELTVPGALVFSPPSRVDECLKFHICVSCWSDGLERFIKGEDWP